LAACSRGPLDAEGEGEEAAEIVLALQAPSDIRCVAVSVETDRKVVRSFDLSGGTPTTLLLPRLSVGVAVLSVEAFTATCAAAPGTVAPWFGGPLSVLLKPGANGPYVIVLHRQSQATVSVDFADAGAPTCAPVKSACLTDADCCSKSCKLDPSNATLVGVCAEAPASAHPSVKMDFKGEKSYLFYPLDGGPGCGASSPETFAVNVSKLQGSVCIPASVGDVIPILIETMQTCSTETGTCSACEDESCLLSTCFGEAPTVSTASPSCKYKLSYVDGSDLYTRYVLVKKIDPRMAYMRPEGLPRFISSPSNRSIEIAPAAGVSAFGVARVGTALLPADFHPDSCGGLSLCGIVPYQGYNSVFLNGWFWSSTNILMAPLF
jgi:hypothetical protein